MALDRVDRVGENKALEMNSFLSTTVGASRTEFSEWMGGSSSIFHSLVLVRVPCIINISLCLIYNLSLSKIALQFASHSCPMLSRDPEARCGKMWALHAAAGRLGMRI